MYEVKLGQFTGPLEKLLELIEEKKLEITQISMAEVTGDFLKYVKNLGAQVPSLVLADFLVVASKLVLIKSKVLLPNLELTSEEEGDIRDLEHRLKIYREFKTASQYLQKLWNNQDVAYSRPLFANLGEKAIFYPPSEIKTEDLAKAISNLISALQNLVPDVQKIKSAVVTIEQKIEELLNRFTQSARQSFKGIAQSQSRTEIIVVFLAILHLLKDKIINVEQEGQFGDILIEKSPS
ncbi:MAG: segregation/condensation protein A [Patescibacteria group bacterium]